jgi:hypothetical protein
MPRKIWSGPVLPPPKFPGVAMKFPGVAEILGGRGGLRIALSTNNALIQIMGGGGGCGSH